MSFLSKVFEMIREVLATVFVRVWNGSKWCLRTAVRGSALVAKTAVAVPLGALSLLASALTPAPRSAAQGRSAAANADTSRIAELESKIAAKAAAPKFKPPHYAVIEGARYIARGQKPQNDDLLDVDPDMMSWTLSLTKEQAQTLIRMNPSHVADHVNRRRRVADLPPMWDQQQRLALQNVMDRIEREYPTPKLSQLNPNVGLAM